MSALMRAQYAAVRRGSKSPKQVPLRWLCVAHTRRHDITYPNPIWKKRAER